ncbi:uncharacterized protein LOC108344176 [Vigna angularis]|uniref:uncharacterized protein LOC108344176 n=1 Tax=Phaseolus angularis TaxID=3914 RepID=UPI00080A795A|nr:uncharacterized protein LOC108344176 [Vigna angularis]
MGQGQFVKSGQAGQFNRPLQQQSQWQQISALSDRTSKLEETFQQFMQVTIFKHKSTEAAIRNLEMQVSQLAKKLEDKVEKQFGANIEVNPKEECKSIECEKIDKEKQYERFKEIFKQLEIIVPLTEALQQIPTYAKHLKKVLKKKRYLDEETIDVQGNCSFILQKTLPPKVKDPESFNIPCVIGNVEIGKALIDLGSSINLMFLSVLERIGGLKMKPTKVSLQLVDGYTKEPYGVAEDVVVCIDKLRFLVDFVVMEMEEDL